MDEERLLEAWVGITGILKNSRLTNEISYNESIVMMLAYRQYMEDGVGEISVQKIIERTKMLKSLVNRTLNALEKKEMIIKKRGENDSRRVYICPTKKGIEKFLTVHNHSLQLVRDMVEIIGEEDAKAIIRVYEKMTDTDAFTSAYSTKLLRKGGENE